MGGRADAERQSAERVPAVDLVFFLGTALYISADPLDFTISKAASLSIEVSNMVEYLHP